MSEHLPARSRGARLTLPAAVFETARRKGYEQYLLEAPLVVGVSGGADSLALLYALSELRPAAARNGLHVAHLDHGLRGGEAEEDALFVAATAESLGLRYTLGREDVPTYASDHRLSPEEAARDVRYAFLVSLARDLDAVVAVAHTADDQVETVLMNLIRGSGIGGLAGMKMLAPAPVAQSNGQVLLYRPLLETWRDQIKTYCAERGLEPRLDATNADTRYRRNLVRQRIVPALEEAQPGAKERILRLSRLAAVDEQFLADLAEHELERVATFEDGRAADINVGDFGALPGALRLRVARQALGRVANTLQGLDLSHVLAAESILAGAEGSPTAADLPHGLVIQRTNEVGRIRRRGPNATTVRDVGDLIDSSPWPLVAPGQESAVQVGRRIGLTGDWLLECDLVSGDESLRHAGSYAAVFDAEELRATGNLVLRGRRTGDFIRPIGLGGTRTLQDLYVDAKMPPSLRKHAAVLAIEDAKEVLWVPGPGGRRSERAAVGPGTAEVIILRFTRANEPDEQC